MLVQVIHSTRVKRGNPLATPPSWYTVSFLKLFPEIFMIKIAFESNYSWFFTSLSSVIHHISPSHHETLRLTIQQLLPAPVHSWFLRHSSYIFFLRVWFKSNGSCLCKLALSDMPLQFPPTCQTTIDHLASSDTSSSFLRKLSSIFSLKNDLNPLINVFTSQPYVIHHLNSSHFVKLGLAFLAPSSNLHHS